jgi:hypothetical protein
MIEVVDSDAGGLEVEMNFAGLATSSAQYAQLFSTQQLASYQPSATAPSYQPPSTGAPTYQPSPSAPPVTDDPDPNADPMDEMDDDGMSPTSGEPAVQPEMLDI